MIAILIAILLNLGIISSSDDYHQASDAQQAAWEASYIVEGDVGGF